MIKWLSVTHVKLGTTSTALIFLTIFLTKKQRSPGSVNYVPQCEISALHFPLVSGCGCMYYIVNIVIIMPIPLSLPMPVFYCSLT